MHQLIWAVRQGQMEDVRRLLQMGTPVNTRDAYGNTALMWAVNNQHLEIVRLLLEHGANPRKGHVYYTPLTLSLQRDNPALEQMIREALTRSVFPREKAQWKTPSSFTTST